MPSDALLAQTAPGIKTATFSTTGVMISTWGKSRILNPIAMRVIYSAAQNSSGANSWTFTSELSVDNGSTWSTMSGLPPIALSTTPKADEVFLEIDLNSSAINPTMANNPIIRLTGTLAGAGSGATINVTNVDIVPTVLT